MTRHIGNARKHSMKKRNVFLSSGGVCWYCLRPIRLRDATLEHLTPISRGGGNHMNNLGIACGDCDKKKNTKTVLEFVADLPQLGGR